jgi:hypothetical protein
VSTAVYATCPIDEGVSYSSCTVRIMLLYTEVVKSPLFELAHVIDGVVASINTYLLVFGRHTRLRSITNACPMYSESSSLRIIPHTHTHEKDIRWRKDQGKKNRGERVLLLVWNSSMWGGISGTHPSPFIRITDKL